MSLFDFDRISPGIDGPRFLSAGGGYPNEVGSGRVDVVGGGIMTRAQLRDLQENARPGYPMIGGNRNRSRKSRRSRNRNKSYKKKSKAKK